MSFTQLHGLNRHEPPDPGPFRAVGSRVLRLAGLRCRLLYPAAAVDGAAAAPYLSEGRQTSEPWPWIRRGGHEIRTEKGRVKGVTVD